MQEITSMPYSLAQILLTVLFNFVAVFGFFFVLIACAAEASQRQPQSQSDRSAPLHGTERGETLSFSGLEIGKLDKISLKSHGFC